MHEPAARAVRAAARTREGSADLGLVRRRLVLRDGRTSVGNVAASALGLRWRVRGEGSVKAKQGFSGSRTCRARSSSTPWANWHLWPYGQPPLRIHVLHSSVCEVRGEGERRVSASVRDAAERRRTRNQARGAEGATAQRMILPSPSSGGSSASDVPPALARPVAGWDGDRRRLHGQLRAPCSALDL